MVRGPFLFLMCCTVSSCITSHIGDVGKLSNPEVEFSCNESGPLEKNVSVVTCIFVRSGPAAKFAIHSAVVKSGEETFAALNPKETEETVKAYQELTSQSSDSTVAAFSWVGLIAMGSAGSSGGSSAAGIGAASGMALAGKNSKKKLKKANAIYGPEHLLGTDIDLVKNDKLEKTALFKYDLRKSGLRTIKICTTESPESCQETQLNRVSDARKRG